jgi:hypothetical protein
MDKRARLLFLIVLTLFYPRASNAVDARFDLVGPKIDVRVTRTASDGTAQTLPIAAIPNLQAGDKLWIHPDLPPTQSVKYLLICVFLRGNTNPPPDSWFTRIETWNPKVREEGVFVIVPPEAQQAVMFMAPETGGDFSTLRSAVDGSPATFVRASQDLIEAGFEEARIEKYLASIRRVPPSDPEELQKRSDLLARTLALKPNADCFKRPVDTQFTCLTQTGTQTVLDDGHGQTLVSALSTGPGSDFIQQASYTQALGAGTYSAYVGAIVDMVRIMGSLHTAQYRYIPAISFPQGESMNLRLNTPPSFHNPKSVLVIALPSVQAATPPPLRPATANEVACLIKPSVVLPIEGAPLVFSTDFAHDLVLHLNTPAGAPPEADIPLIPDAYSGGLRLQKDQQHRTLLRDPEPLKANPEATAFAHPDPDKPPTPAAPPPKPQPKPVLLTGTIQGRWGFDPYTGPIVSLQQLPGTDWLIVPDPAADTAPGMNLIAGHAAQLLLTSTGSACVHTITAHPTTSSGAHNADLSIPFKLDPKPEQPNRIQLTLPLEHELSPGDLHLAIQQYDQPKADEVSARTFSEPAHVTDVELHAGDKTLLLKGTRLSEIDKVTLGDLTFAPAPESTDDTQPGDAPTTLHFALPANAPAPPTHIDDHLSAKVSLRDGRALTLPVTVSSARPVISLLSKNSAPPPGSTITLSNPDDLALSSLLTFTLKSPAAFPRNGQVEIETLDGTLRTVLTLAPSGGLLLQDPHTVVATLDPLRSFGPSAFGALHVRAIFPLQSRTRTDSHPTSQPEPAQTPGIAAQPATAPEDPAAPASNWLPLVTLVRLPTLSQLQCPADTTQPCTVTGSSLFLLEDVSISPAFDDPQPVPDGYTGTTLTVPHPAAATLFLKLRDDPTNIDSAILPLATPHIHNATHAVPQTPAPQPPPPATTASPTPTKPESPTPAAPSSPSTQKPS